MAVETRERLTAGEKFALRMTTEDVFVYSKVAEDDRELVENAARIMAFPPPPEDVPVPPRNHDLDWDWDWIEARRFNGAEWSELAEEMEVPTGTIRGAYYRYRMKHNIPDPSEEYGGMTAERYIADERPDLCWLDFVRLLQAAGDYAKASGWWVGPLTEGRREDRADARS